MKKILALSAGLAVLGIRAFAAGSGDDAFNQNFNGIQSQVPGPNTPPPPPLPQPPIPASLKPERAIDLGGQFPTPPNRSQGSLGSCHAFASVALMEAAYYRQTGQHLMLSEADMFLQKTILQPDLFNDLLYGKCSLSEGGWPDKDLEFANKNGIATDDFYPELLDKYSAWKCDLTQSLGAPPLGAASPGAPDETAQNAAELKKKRMTEVLMRLQKAFGKLKPDPLRACYKEETSPNAVEEREAAFTADRLPELQEERQRVRGLFQGFHVGSWNFDGSCRAAENYQEQRVLWELEKGRPVAVGINIAGIPGWNAPGPAPVMHDIVITGVEYSGDDGSLVFRVRNSWGGYNPPVPESKMCGIWQVVVELAPGEAAD